MKKQLAPFALLVLLSAQMLQAQWTSLGSGITTKPRTLAGLSVVNENVIWALALNPTFTTKSQDFTRTTDGGQTWQPGVITGIDPSYYPLQVFALDDQTAWVTTTDEKSPIKGSIYKTTDGGTTWQEQSTGFTGFNETPAGIHFWNAQEGFAYGAPCNKTSDDQISIYTTDDGGANWTKVVAPNMPAQLPAEGQCLFNLVNFFAVEGDSVWFGSDKGRMFSSIDRGRTWTVTSTPVTVPITSVWFKDSKTGLAVTQPFKLLRTTDGGQTWTQLAMPFSGVGYQVEHIAGTKSTWLIVSDFTEHLISYDDGDTWMNISSNADTWAVKFLDPNTGFAASYLGNPQTATASLFKWSGMPLGTHLNVDKDVAVEVMPNPATSFLQLRLPDAGTPPVVTVQVFDAQGRLVLHTPAHQAGQALDVARLTPGLYTLKVVADKRLYAGRFVKL